MATQFTNVNISNTLTATSIDSTSIQATTIQCDDFNVNDFSANNLECDSIAAIGTTLAIEGQTINIGINGSSNVNILGQLNYITSDQLQIKDPLITINKGGNDGTAINAGIEVEGTSAAIKASLKLDSNLDWVIDSANDKLTSANITSSGTIQANNIICDGTISSVDNIVPFNSSITVSSNFSCNGNATLGDTSTDSHTIWGSTLFKNNTTMDGNLTLKGNAQIGDSVLDSHTINGSTTFSDSVLMNSDLTLVGGDITGVDNISSNSANITTLTTNSISATTYGPISSTGDISTTGNISCVNLTSTGNTTISGGLTVDTQTLKLDNTLNRVGINTASPGATLDINGTQFSRSDIYTGGSNHYYYDFTNSKSKALRNIGTNDTAGTEFSGNLLDRGGNYSFQQRGTQPASYKTSGMFGWNPLTAGLTGGNYNFIQSCQASNSLSGIGHVYGFGYPYSFDGTNYISYPDYYLFLQSTSGGANTCQFLLKKNEGGQFTHNNESASSTLGLVTAGVTNCALKVNGGEYITRNLLVNENITTNTGDIVVNTNNKSIIFNPSGTNNKIYYDATDVGIDIDCQKLKLYNNNHTNSTFTFVQPNPTTSSSGLYIDSGGRVGVNMNPSSLYNFDVSGDTRITGDMVLQGTMNITNNMAIGANSTVSGNLLVSGTCTINGISTINNDINFLTNGKVITLGDNCYINCLPSAYVNLDFSERYRRGGKKQSMMSLRFNSTTLTANTRPQLTLTNGYTFPTGNLPSNNSIYLQADKSTFEFTGTSGGGTYKIEVRVCEAATANIQRTFQLYTSSNGLTYTLHEEKRSVFIYNAFNPTYFSHQYDFILDTEALGINYFYLYYTGGTGNITQTALGQSSVLVYQIS